MSENPMATERSKTEPFLYVTENVWGLSGI